MDVGKSGRDREILPPLNLLTFKRTIGSLYRARLLLSGGIQPIVNHRKKVRGITRSKYFTREMNHKFLCDIRNYRQIKTSPDVVVFLPAKCFGSQLSIQLIPLYTTSWHELLSAISLCSCVLHFSCALERIVFYALVFIPSYLENLR